MVAAQSGTLAAWLFVVLPMCVGAAALQVLRVGSAGSAGHDQGYYNRNRGDRPEAAQPGSDRYYGSGVVK